MFISIAHLNNYLPTTRLEMLSATQIAIH